MANSKNNSFLNLITADLYKVSKHKSIYIALAVMFFLLLVSFASIWVLTNADLGDTEISISGKDYLFTSIESADIGLFIAIIAGLFIGKEFSEGMMRITVARGAKRVQVYFSKFIVLICLVVVYSIIILILGGIFTAITGYGQPFNGAEFGLVMRMFALELLALISSTSIFTMFAFLLRTPGSTIGAAIGFYLAITIITSVLTVIAEGYIGSNPAKAQSILQAAYYLPYQQSAVSTSYALDIETSSLIPTIIMPIVYTIISSLIGCLSFIKRDIK